MDADIHHNILRPKERVTLERDRKERIVIILRKGLYGFERCTLAKIGKLLGVTRERIRQIEAMGLRRTLQNWHEPPYYLRDIKEELKKGEDNG